MLNSFQHPSCRQIGAGRDRTLNQVQIQGDAAEMVREPAADRRMTAPAIIARSLRLSAALLAVFVRGQLRSAHPVLDVRVFADRRFAAASSRS